MARGITRTRKTRVPNPTKLPTTTSTTGRGGRGGGVVDHALHDHAVHFIPWVILAVFWLAGTLLHAFVTLTWSRVGTVALILVSTMGLTYSVWATQRDRTGTARWHGVTTTALGGGWLALCTCTGFITIDGTMDHWAPHTHGFTIATFAVCGAALAAIWNTRITARRHAAELAALLAQQEPEVTRMEIAGHVGAVIRGLRQVNEFTQTGTLVLAPGDTLLEFQKDLQAVESAHGWPPGSVKVWQLDKTTNAQMCGISITIGNPLEHPQPWPGLLVGTK